MLVSYKWLSEFIDLTGETPHTLAEKITRSGIEVESVNTFGLEMKNIVVGKVCDCQKHPDADKLKVCLVDIGQGENLQIVCGASNVSCGQIVPVALVGAILPGNFKIKASKIRGVTSNGMICSLLELGVSPNCTPKEFLEGIYVFPSDTQLGIDAIKALHLDDAIIELGLTPNRSDCLSMIGVAYEVAAILGKEITISESKYTPKKPQTPNLIKVTINADDNPLYIAKVISNIKIKSSPLWLQARLIAGGIRPHSNVVDISNYVLLEYGQPLHTFDYDKFASKEIVVRYGKPFEKILTLDDCMREVTSEQVVITNGRTPVALAGVMGGASTAVTCDTTSVLLEAAYFNKDSVRKTSKYHGLRSESSIRFEKGVDPLRVRLAAARAASLLEQLAEGQVVTEVCVDNLVVPKSEVTVTLAKINRILGTNLSAENVCDLLLRLEFPYTLLADEFKITIPSRRGDITIAEDIVEEVARLYGYDNIGKTLPQVRTKVSGLTDYQQKRRKIANFFVGKGFRETLTYSLTSFQKAGQFNKAHTPIALAMPLSEERAFLRLSLISGLIDVAQFNLARQNTQINLFEISSVFLGNETGELPNEEEHLAGLITGNWEESSWSSPSKQADFFILKGILEELFSHLGVLNMITWKQAEVAGLHPGRTGEIYLKSGEYIGVCGELHPEIASENDLKETYVFELNLSLLLNIFKRPKKFTAIQKFPAVTRDIAFVFDNIYAASEIQKVIEKAGGNLLKEIKIFDLYEGKNIEAGKKSIAFSLKYYDPKKTLTDEEVTYATEKITKEITEKFNATQRK